MKVQQRLQGPEPVNPNDIGPADAFLASLKPFNPISHGALR